MVGLAGAIVFVGYTLLAFGNSQIHGSNAGLFDITWPGRFSGANSDSGSGSGNGGANNQFPSKGHPQGPNTRVKIGNGRTTPSKNLPGGQGNGVSP